jgi:hypothetical protein
MLVTEEPEDGRNKYKVFLLLSQRQTWPKIYHFNMVVHLTEFSGKFKIFYQAWSVMKMILNYQSGGRRSTNGTA